MMKQNIEKSRELEFAIFCIENIAAKLGVSAEKVYDAQNVVIYKCNEL